MSFAVACFVVSAVAVTTMSYIPAAVGVQVTVALSLLTQPEPAGAFVTVKSVFSVVTVISSDFPTSTLAGDGEMEMDTTIGGAETVSFAVACFVASSVAVTVTSYTPAAVGVQVTVVLPVLTQPEPAGAFDTVKSVFSVVTVSGFVSPTLILNDDVIEMLTGFGLLSSSFPFLSSLWQADKNNSDIIAAITMANRVPFRCLILSPFLVEVLCLAWSI